MLGEDSVMQTEGFRLGSTLAIHARNADGSAGQQVGAGQIIHPQLVQVLPPLDSDLAKKARRSEDFLLLADQGKGKAAVYQVQRIRPGLLSHAEAGEILARELPGIQLAEPSSERIVAFETAEWLADDPDEVCDSPWWCRIVCLTSCASC
jgi:hypothetical protein